VTIKRRYSRVLPLTLGVTGGILLICAAVSAGFDRISKGINAGPQRLLYQTDHAAVLRACREVLADPQAAGFPDPKNGQTTMTGQQGGGTPPATLPAPLRELNFEFMLVQGDHATIFFGGGFGQWGFRTMPAHGDTQVEVVPGLWFWTEYSIPRDPSKHPYFRTSKRMLLGGVGSLALAIVLRRYLRQSAVAAQR
jgi:hypothetical protein